MANLDAPDAESKVAKDLFLEALIFAADPMPLLEAAWPDLIADEGKLLNRLMDRLLFVASFPDPRFARSYPRRTLRHRSLGSAFRCRCIGFPPF